MLNKVSWPRVMGAAEARLANPDEGRIDLYEVVRLLRRQKRLIATVLGFSILGALLYLAITPARYTASSMLLFDVRKSAPLQQQGYANEAADSAYVDSQVEVLRSEDIARSVIKRLGLLSDPEFAPPPGLLGTAINGLRRVFGAGPASTEADLLARAVRKLQANLTIKRTGLTYVVSIDYRSLSAEKAARISNAVTDAYFVGQLDSRYRAAGRANSWLQERIKELKTQAEATERAVAEYKSKNSTVDADGRLLTEQQIAELSSQRRVLLKDLESSAQTYRALHQSLLQRVTEFTQQQSFPTTDARVVSEAMPPLEKSDPKVLLILAAATLLGLVGGLGAGFAREYFDKSLRTPSQLQNALGVECLGVLPAIVAGPPFDESDPLLRWMPRLPYGRNGNHGDNQIHEEKSRQSAPLTGDRKIGAAGDLFRYVVDDPFSRFAETIRSLQIAAELAGLNGGKKVLGITSAQAREGKSLVAANLSEMLALSGSRVLLIDGQTRNRELTLKLTPQATAGLMHAMANTGTLNEVIWRDPSTNLDFLPMDAVASPDRPVGVVSASTMQGLLAAVQDRYDYIMIDLPALSPLADVKAISNLIDHFIFVIEWGAATEGTILNALDAAPLVYEKLLGAVLNKADVVALRALES
jgi:capsular exopolysaccharide synthesis family protein